MREIMLIMSLKFRQTLFKERITLIQRINGCPAIRKIDVLSFGNLDKTPIKTLEFDAREFLSIRRSIHYLVNLRDLSEISRGEGSVNRSLKRESHEKIGSERARRVT